MTAQEVYAQNVDSLLQQARIHKTENDLVASLRCYLQVARINETRKKTDNLAAIYGELAEVYEDGNLYEKALEYYQKSNAAKPGHAALLKMAEMSVKLRRYETALNEYSKLLELAKDNADLKELELSILRKMVAVHQYLGQYEQALLLNERILSIYTGQTDLEGQIVTLNNIGYAQKHLKNYKKAIQNFQEVLKLEKSANRRLGNKSTTLINLGITYQNNGDYGLAINNLLEAAAVIEASQNKSEMAQIYDILSVVYFNLKDYYNAAYYNDLATKYAKQAKDKPTLAKTYYTASMLAQADEKYDKALEYFQEHLLLKDSLILAEEIRQQGLMQQQFVVERAEKEIKLLMVGEEIKDLALKQLKIEAEKKMQELELLQREKELQQSKLSEEEAQKKNALQKLLILQQKANADKKDRAITELQRIQALKELELQKQMAAEQEKQNEIRLLTKDRELQNLKLDQQGAAIERQIAAQRNSYWFIALGIFIFLLVLAGLFQTRRKNNQLSEQQHQISEKNAELQIQNEKIAAQRDVAESLSLLIARKNEDITASINYAKRIQQAMLPSADALAAVFGQNNFFVLNKPRDIVSGDFFWLSRPTDEHPFVVLAVADCTGHGVPGALMSMVGMNTLDLIVNREGLTQPNLVLDVLNLEVPRALHQGDSDIRDGMDIVVLTLNTQDGSVLIAGAMNPVCIVQPNENKVLELKEIKGNNLPIGSKLKSTQIANYTLQSVPDNQESTFYLYSDGYQDQFGGPKNRKFMSKRFKELLLNIADKPMREQQETLENTIQSWMKEADEKQIDDILVVGIRQQKNQQ